MNDFSVKIEDLSKSYKGVEALRGISLDVTRGEIFGFIGPDGAGKTTLFRILVSLLLPDAGHATVEGLDVVRDYRKIRKIVGYMPGRFSLYQDLSVEENLKFFASIFNTSIQENYYLIEDIYKQIEPFRKRLAGKLSGGMKQKLALSCALIHKPDVLFLDEPTTGVDAVSRKEFWEMLKRLRSWGITILVSTPYMDEAGMCDRVALMQEGAVMSINTPEGVINDHHRPLAEVRTDNMFQLVDNLVAFDGCYSAYRFGAFVHFSPKENQLEVKDLEEYLKLKGHSSIKIKMIRPGIEDCFMELMGVKDNV
ncbi:MAG: ABC transporter ATP-binding protein [Bacteroidetes bacterium]|nr:ABC transporter ATP-binding protein [Bacteroidota bacterium]